MATIHGCSSVFFHLFHGTKIFARATGQSYERICHDTQRNYWLSAEEAKNYGLVHQIIERMDDWIDRV
jgi:ATP-dependent protease ClpP protease subunit